ncbi:MAG: glycosyl hydrolase family 18 protein [Francisella sp.]
MNKSKLLTALLGVLLFGSSFSEETKDSDNKELKLIQNNPILTGRAKDYWYDYKFDSAYSEATVKVWYSLDIKASNIIITTNFKPKGILGYTCFGVNVSDLQYVTLKNEDGTFWTRIDGHFSFSKNFGSDCHIAIDNTYSPYNSSNISFPIVPYIENVALITDVAFSLPIFNNCPDSICKDPTPGYINAGTILNSSNDDSVVSSSIRYDKINNLYYGYIDFDEQGDIKTLNPNFDKKLLTSIAYEKKKYPYFKAFLSLGGVTHNGVPVAPIFDKLTSNESYIDSFVSNAVEFLSKTGFDGINIDWEWWSSYYQAPSQKMLMLLKKLREYLDKKGQEDNKMYYLSLTVPGSKNRLETYQNPANPDSVPDFWSQIGTIVDQVNIINYDYTDSMYKGLPSWFQATKSFPDIDFTPEEDVAVHKSEGWSIQDSVDTLLDSGVPHDKLIVGMSLVDYTNTVDSNKNGGLLQMTQGPGVGDKDKGILYYKCLVNPVNDSENGCQTDNPLMGLSNLIYYNSISNVDLFNKYGKDAMQPWAYSPSTNSFITYDDVWSVMQKTKYAKTRGFAGTMFWQVNGDSRDDDKSLINTAVKVYGSHYIDILVSNVKTDSATITWNKPELKGNDMHYSIYLNDKFIADIPSYNLSYVFDNLEGGAEYNVKVVATTSEERASGEIAFKTVVPVPPHINVTVGSITDKSATITWNKPDMKGDISYSVFLDGKEVASGLPDLSYNLSDLSEDTEYKVKVVAITSRGESISSDEVSFKTNKNPIPYIYTTVSNITKNSATVSWNKPDMKGDISYSVFLDGKEVVNNLHTLNYDLSGLTEDTEYTVKVVASNAQQSVSDETTFRTAK